MERRASLDEAKQILGSNFIGADELNKISEALAVKIPEIVPQLPFDVKTLEGLNSDYLLILGVSQLRDGRPLTINALRNIFGTNDGLNSPCFYNQDWYLNEEFINVPLVQQWYLVRKNVIEETRAVNPDLILKSHSFPSAILCTYAFLASWFHSGKILWEFDFVWCSDKDHNGDRIYVGKYRDIDGVNKDGFSIHRHLSLRNCYGAI
nr:hypothetical protein [uncultured Mucilaginibacter sp.]